MSPDIEMGPDHRRTEISTRVHIFPINCLFLFVFASILSIAEDKEGWEER
jgi:hypothetical protein